MVTTSIVAQPVDSWRPDPSGIETFLTVGMIYIVIINLVALMGMVALAYTCLPKQRRRQPLHQVQCHHCQYFKTHADLKCALHPISVLTTQAVDCADYWSKS